MRQYEEVEGFFDKIQLEMGNWAILGSFSLFMRGIKIKPNDLDIIADLSVMKRLEGQLFGSAFNGSPEFEETENIRSYFFRGNCGTFQVEIFSDIENQINRKWLNIHLGWQDNVEWIVWEKFCLPVVRASFELEVHRKLGYHKKADVYRQACMT
ncbi:MAG: hypothetical protein H6851_13265 [Geminicoccaceae bacterium]|nr:hypothetical protein [Geminicoccaceae bacterium]